MTFIPYSVVEKVKNTVLLRNDATEIVVKLRDLDVRLRESEIYLEEARSQISIWDRINIFSKTIEEDREHTLKKDIKQASASLKTFLHELDLILMNTIVNLSRSDETIKSFIVWSEVHRLRKLISVISIDADPFGIDPGLRYSIRGKERCLTAASDLEEIVRMDMDDPISIHALLDEIKKDLLVKYE